MKVNNFICLTFNQIMIKVNLFKAYEILVKYCSVCMKFDGLSKSYFRCLVCEKMFASGKIFLCLFPCFELFHKNPSEFISCELANI